MGTLGYLTIALSAVWAISEIRIIVRKRSMNPSQEKDRLSLRFLMLTNGISITAAVLIKVVPAIVGGLGRITLFSPFLGYFGCLVIAAGLAIRWVAIATLKHQFTADVSIVRDHEIVDHGLYGVVRHPAYLGGLLSFIGLGLALENWFSLAIVFLLPLAAIGYRISVEERALVEHFGTSYIEYAKRTKRLIPGVL